MKAKAAFYFLILCRQLLSLEICRAKKGVEVKVHCRTKGVLQYALVETRCHTSAYHCFGCTNTANSAPLFISFTCVQYSNFQILSIILFSIHLHRCYLILFSPYKLLASVMFSSLHTLPEEKENH